MTRWIWAFSLALVPFAAFGGSILEDFENDPQTRWAYVQDGVMGGVSQGQAQLVETDIGPAVQLTGTVSTDNNGGFIQVRHRFADAWPANAKGLRITARGNGENYFVFLRTRGMARRWHSYRQSFPTGADWATKELPFTDFQPSHAGMPPNLDPAQVIGIGIVAYGKDHQADLTVTKIEMY